MVCKFSAVNGPVQVGHAYPVALDRPGNTKAGTGGWMVQAAEKGADYRLQAVKFVIFKCCFPENLTGLSIQGQGGLGPADISCQNR